MWQKLTGLRTHWVFFSPAFVYSAEENPSRREIIENHQCPGRITNRNGNQKLETRNWKPETRAVDPKS